MSVATEKILNDRIDALSTINSSYTMMKLVDQSLDDVFEFLDTIDEYNPDSVSRSLDYIREQIDLLRNDISKTLVEQKNAILGHYAPIDGEQK